jgi:glycosyltransferase involved in cell wall biosynthesis
MEPPKRVFVYTVDFFPQIDGNGRDMRTFSNVRAYLDLGYQTELVHVRTGPGYRESEAHISGLKTVMVDASEHRPSRFQHAAYLARFPLDSACAFYYKSRAALLSAARERQLKWPSAIHHFETLAAAHVVPWLPNANALWSCLEIPSDFVARGIRIDAELENRAIYPWEARKVAFLKKAERTVAERSSMVLCVTKKDAANIRDRWRRTTAEYLPMSVPDEVIAARVRSWLAGGTFEVLHLGQIHHLPTFRSLTFLFEKVLPRLSPETMRRIRLNIVGPIGEDLRCSRLQELGARFPQVKFVGRSPDLRPIYGWNDVQIVASTEATGIRTRMIESFAYGLPVLSSKVAADGIEGLRDGENVVLAETAEQFVAELNQLGNASARLARLAAEGRALYEARYSSKVVANELQRIVKTFDKSRY